MRDALPLMQLFASANHISGRTKVQKIVFLMQSMGFPFGQRFRYHLHGPYAQSVTNNISQLVKLGLIAESPVEVGLGTRFDYSALPELEGFLRELPASEPTSPHVDSFDEALAELNAQDPAILELTATAVYLLNHADVPRNDLGSELAKRKPRLAAHIDQALAYLEKLRRKNWIVVD